MMKIRQLWAGIILGAVSFLFFISASSWAQSSEGEEALPLDAGFKKSAPGVLRKELQAYKEVKFVAGPDKQWFTPDDQIYQYYLAEYDDLGRMIKKIGYKDDQPQEYWVYKYNVQNRPVEEIYYKNNPLNS